MHQKRSNYEEPTYKPKISKKSEKLVKGIIDNLQINKIPHYELLLYKGKEYEMNREKVIKEKEEKQIKYEKGLLKRFKANKIPYPKTKHEKIYDVLEDIPIDDSSLLLKPNYDDSEEMHKSDLENNSLGTDFININFEHNNTMDDEDTFTSKIHTLESDEISTSMNNDQKYPILFVDINLGKNQIERITIYEGKNTLSSI